MIANRRRAVPVAFVFVVALVVAGCGDPPSVPADTAGSSPVSTQAAASSETVPVALPPFIERTTWVQTPSGRSLQVVPTASGRRAQGAGDEDEAWREVVADDATADSPGMRAQFDCHWTFARIVAPDKPSWNLEPWRPVVSDQQMIDDRCNPGGAEE